MWSIYRQGGVIGLLILKYICLQWNGKFTFVSVYGSGSVACHESCTLKRPVQESQITYPV